MATRFISDESMFDVGADILINATNCDGIMGAGIALEFNRRFPKMFIDYVKVCERGCVPGVLHTFIENDTIIINFPTKYKVVNPSELIYVVRGLASLVNTLVGLRPFLRNDKGKRFQVAIPALGCGLGGLKWENIKPLIENVTRHPLLSDFDFLVFEPK
jgi:O-acetyl-ADP-ribose deacetylase (regulator of RNase III)